MKLTSFLKRVVKYVLICTGVLLVLFGVTVWIIFEKKNDWLLQELQSYLNESQSGQLEIESIDLSLFTNLPDVTIVLKGIRFYQHRDSLRTPDEKPMLQAKQFFVALKLIPLLREEVNIAQVSLATAKVTIETNKNGVTNWELALAPPQKTESSQQTPVAAPKPATPPDKPRQENPQQQKPKPAPTQSSVQVDLDHVKLTDVDVTWYKSGDRDTSRVNVSQLAADLKYSDSVRQVSISSKQNLQNLVLNSRKYSLGEFELNVKASYDKRSKRFDLLDGKMNLEGFEIASKGAYTLNGNRSLDLNIDASVKDLKFMAGILKPEVLRKNPDLLNKGSIYLKGRVFGDLKTQQPQFDFSFGVRKLSWNLPNRDLAFQNIGFEGRFQSGSSPDYSQAQIEIKNLEGSVPGGNVNGYFGLKNFVEPYVNYDLRSTVRLDGYDEVFNLASISDLSGSLSVQANFDGPLSTITQHKVDSNRASMIDFQDINFTVSKTAKKVKALSGKIQNRNMQTVLDGVALQYGENDIQLDATFDGLLLYIFNRQTRLTATGKMSSRQLFTQDFIPDTTVSAEVQDRISNLSLDFKMSTIPGDSVNPGGLDFEIRHLMARFDELPDILQLDTRGKWQRLSDGSRLFVDDFTATFPQGKAVVVGNLLAQKSKPLTFEAAVKLTNFPWTYIKDLAAEMQEGQEPSAKNMPAEKMDFVSADLAVTASIIPYPFDITSVALRSEKTAYTSAGSKPISAEKLNISLDHLTFFHPENAGALTGLRSADGVVDMKKLILPGLTLNGLKIKLSGASDLLKIDFSCVSQKAGSEKGLLQLDLSRKAIGYKLDYAVQKADVAKIIASFSKQKFLEGAIDYNLSLAGAGADWSSVKKSLDGNIEISGTSLILHGMDIDNVLKKYQKSQNFNLTDVGAVVVAGPIGLAITKGKDFVSLATVSLDSSQRTAIASLYTRWKLQNLVLTTEDVAFATLQNRIAFNGQLDIAHDSIPGIVIAVVDKNGCSLMDQKMSGKIGALKTGKLNITKTLLGSVTNFVNAIVGEDCKPVYTGRVKAPAK